MVWPCQDLAETDGEMTSTYLGLDVDKERGNAALKVDRRGQRPRQVQEGLCVHSHVGWFDARDMTVPGRLGLGCGVLAGGGVVLSLKWFARFPGDPFFPSLCSQSKFP